MTPWSIGCNLAVVFGGKKKSLTCLSCTVTLWAEQLSTQSAMYLFFRFISSSVFCSHSVKSTPVIHALALFLYSMGRVCTPTNTRREKKTKHKKMFLCYCLATALLQTTTKQHSTLFCFIRTQTHIFHSPAKHLGLADLPMRRGGSFSVPDMFAHKSTVPRTLLCLPPLHRSPLKAKVLSGKHW